MKTLLAIDQGTTSSRAIVFDLKGNVLAEAQQAFEQHFPNDGWVEHDPNDIWQTVLHCCKTVMTQTDANDIAAIGITNQRETTLIWDKQTGKPIYNAIVWQDRRTAEYCDTLNTSDNQALVAEKTGLRLDPYFSATKIAWVLDHVEGARTKAEAGQLCFGTVDSYLIWQLTQGKSHVTDASNASRTLLFNINTQTWDEELLSLFNIPSALLPTVLDNCDDFGKTDATILGKAIPITGVAGDQQAASVGQACFEPGMVKSTYGTGCFIMMNTGHEKIQSKVNLLATVLYRLNGKVTYGLEGSIFNAGTIVQWFRDKLHFIKHAEDTEAILESTPSTQNVYLVPAFTGLGAPYWAPNARGAIIGLTRDTTDKHIIRAGLESVCYQTKDLLDAMQTDANRQTSTLRIDGGMANNPWLCQFLADMLQCTIQKPKNTETTAQGAAYLAALGAGLFKDLNEITTHWQCDQSFESKQTLDEINPLLSGWRAAVKQVLK